MSSGGGGGGVILERGLCLKTLECAGNTAGNTRYMSYFVQNCMSLVLSKTQSD